MLYSLGVLCNRVPLMIKRREKTRNGLSDFTKKALQLVFQLYSQYWSNDYVSIRFLSKK